MWSLRMTNPSDDMLLNTKQVREQCGNVTTMCLWRWQRDERVQFPGPDAVINGRNYWKALTIKAWQERISAQPRRSGNKPPRNVDLKAAA
jgi:hypothetical protein